MTPRRDLSKGSHRQQSHRRAGPRQSAGDSTASPGPPPLCLGACPATVDQFSTNRATIQYLYPFKVSRWEALRHGLCAFLDEGNDDLCRALSETTHLLKERFGSESSTVRSAVELIEQCLDADGARAGRRRSNASALMTMRSLATHSQRTDDDGHELAHDLAWLELSDLIDRHECNETQSLMSALCGKVNACGLPLLIPATMRPGDNRGVRGYLERRQPHVEMQLRASPLALINPEALPDVSKKLPVSTLLHGKPQIRLSAAIRLESTGFGCLRLRADVANEDGLVERAREIAFSTPGRPGVPTEGVLERKAQLAAELTSVVEQGLRGEDWKAAMDLLPDYSPYMDTGRTEERVDRLLDEVTLVQGPLLTTDLVDVENLDRGLSRGEEPELAWVTPGGERTGFLEDYFKYVVDDVLLSRLADGLLADPDIRDFLFRDERRRDGARRDSFPRNQLMSSLNKLALYGPTFSLEEHPYVSTYVGAPPSFKQDSQTPDQAAEHFRNMFERHKGELGRILTKSKWAEIDDRRDGFGSALDNVFYSDLIHMAVDIRGALCFYYTPTTAQEYLLMPELAQGHKYRQELNDTLQTQRMLWYAYATSEHLVSEDIRSISETLEVLKEHSLEERFPEVIEQFTEVVAGIDRRKVAVAEIAESPLSRKGGSSLFSRMIEKTTDAFHLEDLHRNLQSKLERLDMLGIHISGSVQEYSNLRVQEGSRAAQLTLEFLEAFVVAFYFTELVEHGMRVEVFEALVKLWPTWGMFTVATGAFMTALPLITLIRKGRSKFSFENPKWLERLEKVGVISGPAVLLAMTYGYVVLYQKDEKWLQRLDWATARQALSLPSQLWFAVAFVLIWLTLGAAWYHVMFGTPKWLRFMKHAWSDRSTKRHDRG